jgi:hypothetical protein
MWTVFIFYSDVTTERQVFPHIYIYRKVWNEEESITYKITKDGHTLPNYTMFRKLRKFADGVFPLIFLIGRQGK